MIQSAVLATELTEDGTAARPSDDPARQPRGERPQPRPGRLTLGPAAQGKRSAQRRQARRREGWKPVGARRRRRLDAKHDSPARSRQAEGHARKHLHYPGKRVESDIRTTGMAAYNTANEWRE